MILPHIVSTERFTFAVLGSSITTPHSVLDIGERLDFNASVVIPMMLPIPMGDRGWLVMKALLLCFGRHMGRYIVVIIVSNGVLVRFWNPDRIHLGCFPASRYCAVSGCTGIRACPVV